MKLFLIAPGSLPIPATKGGAIETLMTNIINKNEELKLFNITVLSNRNKLAESISTYYKHTHVIYINTESPFAKCYDLFFRIIRKILNHRINLRTYFLRNAIRLINADHYDVIDIEGRVDFVLPIRCNLNETSKLILHLHSDILNLETSNGREIIENVDYILSVSDYIKNRIIEFAPSSINKQIVYKNAIDVEMFHAKKYKQFREEFRNLHNIKTEDKVILFCGRIDETKGVRELLQAVLNSKTRNHIFLIIIGSTWFNINVETEYIKELKLLAKSLGDSVIFTGYISNSDLPKYYSIADIAVMPSQCNEAAGLVLLEAAASGIPVIATNIGGIPEYASTEFCILVNKGSQFVQDLSNAIDKLVLDEAYYNSLKSQSRSLAMKYNSYNYYLELNNIMKKIIDTN